MNRLKKYVAVSLVFHAVAVFALLDIGFSGKKTDASDVYEVAIVAGAPAGASASSGAGISQGKKFIYNKDNRKAALGEVKKERGLKETAPEISPADIKPEKPVESGPDMAGITGNKGQTARGPGPGGGLASETALWKARVKGMVEMLWKPPPEIEVMDLSLQTTYLLRISRTGELLQKKLLVSSGNAPFDRSILTSLNRVAHFPPPPPSLIAGQDWVEITMSFKPPKGA
jgi:TonB family protein